MKSSTDATNIEVRGAGDVYSHPVGQMDATWRQVEYGDALYWIWKERNGTFRVVKEDKFGSAYKKYTLHVSNGEFSCDCEAGTHGRGGCRHERIYQAAYTPRTAQTQSTKERTMPAKKTTIKPLPTKIWKEAFAVLDALEQTGAGRLEKVAAVKKGKGNPALLKIIRWTYGGQKFYVFPSKGVKGSVMPISSLDFSAKMVNFEELLLSLSSRALSGDKAKHTVDAFISSAPAPVAKWLYRIMQHDWRCGVESSTFEKALGEDVWGDNAVKTESGEKHRYFGCSLGQKYKGWPKGWKEARGEYKLDGWRGTAHVGVKSVTFYTRNGHHEPHTTNLRHIGAQLLRVGFKNCIVDGEIIIDGSWNAVATMRHKNPTEEVKKILREKAIFHAFDYVPLDPGLDSLADEDMPFWKRRKRLFKILKGKRKVAPNVRLVKQWRLKSDADIAKLYAKALEDGYEGLVVKDPDAPYPWKRSSAVLKLKPVRDVDVYVVEVRTGKGKNEDRLGTLVCLKEDGTEVRVGGGYSDEERVKLWAQRKKLVGRWLEAIETDPGNTLKEIKLNHPRFKRWRPDKDGMPLPAKLKKALEKRK